MFESVLTLQAEHDELQSQLADPELHANPARSKKVNRRYAELSRIIAAWSEWKEVSVPMADQQMKRGLAADFSITIAGSFFNC